MRFRRSVLASCLAAAALVLWWRGGEKRASTSQAQVTAGIGAVRPAGESGEADLGRVTQARLDAQARRREALALHAYAQGWDGAQPRELAEFRGWTERYRHTGSAAERSALEAEGLALARARRPVMKALIEREPQRALALTVPAVVRQTLPPSVLAELESRVAGRGDLLSLETNGPDEAPGQPSRTRRVVALGGTSYTAHTYGRREALLTKEGASLHGIALDRQLALHESPLRVLEPGEVPGAAAEEHCPVSQQTVEALTAGAGVNLTALNVVEAGGRVWEFCEADDMLDALAVRLNAAEEQAGPRVVEALGSGGSTTLETPATAADASTAHNTGNQRVLVIRVDFSDFPGEPVGVAAAQTLMDGQVKQYFEEASYGATTLTSTVATNLYRMPRTGASYAVNDDDTALYADARNAAAASYTLSNYDRFVVVFPNIGTARVPGSKITFGGQASLNGASVWINGTFSLRLLMHELGHTYTLKHANLWQVNDGNPVSANGRSIEYKDPYDAMGDASAADARYHYNPWNKNRMGWIPDAQVTTATTSGTYRIYRFDHKDAVASKQPLALRIFRDGVRWYWVGLRQLFTTNSSLTNGAYVVWGTNSLQQTQLLDLTTPGTNTNDAALAVGQTFTDAAYGVTIKVAAKGGEGTEQWLDVEVTVPQSGPPNVASAWGRENAFFYDGDGSLSVPPPETYVPPGVSDLKMIAAGDTHAVGLKADGTVVVWGNDLQGQTGVPIGLADVVSVAAGGNACGAVLRDGTVRVWGDTTTGQRTIPEGLTGVKQLVLGTTHALALKTDGTVVAWGSNLSGQTSVPATLTDVTAIAASTAGSIALKRDGTVVAWGTSTIRTVPTTATNVVAISACGAGSGGGGHVLALRADGTVVAWGNNANGQATIPSGLSGVIAVAAGGFHSLALKADGMVVSWGTTTAGVVPVKMPRSYALAASTRGCFALTGPNVYFTTLPTSQTIAAGETATLSVAALGAREQLTYQWRKDGAAIAGATASTLTLANVAAAAAASYDVVVSDGTNSRATIAARLTVTTPPVVTPPVTTPPVPGTEGARISNLSIRSRAGTSSETLIVGFVVGGTGTTGSKSLLVRGVGPTLEGFGVTGFLSDPKLELYNATSVKIQENDNWNGAATVTTTGNQLGAFAFSSAASRDAALVTSPALSAGNYSAQISGVSGATGVALAEIYDASATGANFTATVPRLVNVSARTTSGTGADILIAGFVVSGPTGSTKKVLIRGIGPTLANFGVSGVLADPKLELYNAGSVKIQENDNWNGTTELGAAFTSVGAFGLVSTTKDAALIATLAPGNYTVQVSGVGGTTGVALVEIYEVP